MTPLAHAGHWIAQLLYLAPVVAMVAAILWSKARGQGPQGADPEGAKAPSSRSDGSE